MHAQAQDQARRIDRGRGLGSADFAREPGSGNCRRRLATDDSFISGSEPTTATAHSTSGMSNATIVGVPCACTLTLLDLEKGEELPPACHILHYAPYEAGQVEARAGAQWHQAGPCSRQAWTVMSGQALEHVGCLARRRLTARRQRHKIPQRHNTDMSPAGLSIRRQGSKQPSLESLRGGA